MVNLCYDNKHTIRLNNEHILISSAYSNAQITTLKHNVIKKSMGIFCDFLFVYYHLGHLGRLGR